jgi:hypothetical protein
MDGWMDGWMLPKIVEDFAPNLATKFAFFGQNWRPSSPVLLLSLFTFSPALFLLARQDDVVMMQQIEDVLLCYILH